MDEELFKIKLHKFLSQHQYLSNLLCETKYLFNKYNDSFLHDYYEPDEIEDRLQKQKEQIQRDKNACEGSSGDTFDSGETEVCENDSIKELTEADVVLTKLYRKLSLKTHPDKVSGQIETFKAISVAYKKKDLLTLLVIAFELKVDASDMLKAHDSLVINMLEENIKNIEKEIHDLKHTVAWHWAHATDDEKNNYKQHTKTK